MISTKQHDNVHLRHPFRQSHNTVPVEHNDEHRSNTNTVTTEDPSSRIVRIGLLTNLGLAGIKLAGGWAFSSKSLTADGWHSLTDLVSDLLVLAAIVLSHTLKGTGAQESTIQNVERYMSLLASTLLALIGLHEAWESGLALSSQLVGRHDIISPPPDPIAPSMQAIWVAALTMLVKEWLYHATMNVAKRINSPILASNAVHQRADSMMSAVTIVAVLASNVLSSTSWIDSVGGLCISAIVTRVALRDLGCSLK